MGTLTTENVAEPFYAPVSGIDWMWHRHEGWWADLVGTHAPIAVMVGWPERDEGHFDRDDVEEFAGLVRKVPTVRHVYLIGTIVGEKDSERLRQLLPSVVVQHEPKPGVRPMKEARPTK